MTSNDDPICERQLCETWSDVASCLETFPLPVNRIDDELGHAISQEWVFRGLADSELDLTPRIERTSEYVLDWPGLELVLSTEFSDASSMVKSRSPSSPRLDRPAVWQIVRAQFAVFAISAVRWLSIPGKSLLTRVAPSRSLIAIVSSLPDRKQATTQAAPS